MIGDAGEQVGEILLRVETVELGAPIRGIDRRGAAAAGIGASEHDSSSLWQHSATRVRRDYCRAPGGRRRSNAPTRSIVPAFNGKPQRARICARAGARLRRPKGPMLRQSPATGASPPIVGRDPQKCDVVASLLAL